MEYPDSRVRVNKLVIPGQTVAFSLAARCISSLHAVGTSRTILPNEGSQVADVTTGATQVPVGVGFFCPKCTVRLLGYWIMQLAPEESAE